MWMIYLSLDNQRLIVDVKYLYKQQYKLQDMGLMEFVLGSKVTQNQDATTIKLSHYKAIRICLLAFYFGILNLNKSQMMSKLLWSLYLIGRL